MPHHFEALERQRNRLLWLGGVLLTAMCGALVLVTWSGQGGGLEFDLPQRWPTLVGLAGMVLLFVLYAQHTHRQLAAAETRLRDLAVRDAALQARFSELSFLFDVSTQLQLRLDLKDMLELAVQRLLPCLDAHQSSIMLYDERDNVLEVKAAAGVEVSRVIGAREVPGAGVAGHVFTRGKSLLLTPEVMRASFTAETKHGRNFTSGLCVPLRFRGTPIGVVCVNRISGEPFSQTHVEILEAFAEHCAATIVKTNHHHDLLKQVRPAA